jgi:hypothetical protein
MILRSELAYLRADLGAVSRMRDESQAVGDFIGFMQMKSRAEELAEQLREAEVEAALYFAVDVEIGFPGSGIGAEHAVNLPLAMEVIAILQRLVALRMPLEPKVQIMTMSRGSMDLIFGDEASVGALGDVGLGEAVTGMIRAVAAASGGAPRDSGEQALLVSLFSALARAGYGISMSDGVASFTLTTSDVASIQQELARLD